MGIVRMGPPEEVVLLLKETFNISTFIETGTYEGGTAIWAAKHFKNVVTIENSKALYDQVVDKYNHIGNISFLFGSFVEKLNQIIEKLEKTAVFWLDAHWCGGELYGEHEQCPIIQELDVLIKSRIPHCILIDDARLFFYLRPPLPNRINQWPTIDHIITTLQSGNEQFYIVIFEDIIIAVPIIAKATLANYLQSLNTKWWQEQAELPRDAGFHMMKQGNRFFIRDIGGKILQAVWKRRK